MFHCWYRLSMLRCPPKSAYSREIATAVKASRFSYIPATKIMQMFHRRVQENWGFKGVILWKLNSSMVLHQFYSLYIFAPDHDIRYVPGVTTRLPKWPFKAFLHAVSTVYTKPWGTQTVHSLADVDWFFLASLNYLQRISRFSRNLVWNQQS